MKSIFDTATHAKPGKAIQLSLSRGVLMVSLAASFAATLTACVPLMVGGAVVGAIVATDRRTSGAQLEDEGIDLRSAGRIRENLGERVHININSYNRRVLLTGEVPTAQDKAKAEQLVLGVDNVLGVNNELEISGNSTLPQRSSDALITAKVKAGLVDAKDLYANAFKVVTERGSTYLLGKVSRREADRATQIAQSVSGVKKVFLFFEIVSEEELKRLLPQQSPATTTGGKQTGG